MQIIKIIILLLTIILKQINCIGYIKSWQTFQNYGNRDLFNEFRIIFQLQHSLISTDVIKLRLPFSIGDLREYPIIKWYELSELTCIFDFLNNSMKPVQVNYLNDENIYEYSLQFNDVNSVMQKDKWYQMNIKSGNYLPSDNTDVIIKIGMTTYSGLSQQTSIIYDQNLELSTIFISPVVSDSLVLTLSNQISYELLPLRTNRIQLNIRQTIVEESGRLLITLPNESFQFTKTSICKSIQDTSLSNVVMMQQGTYTCTVKSNQLEIIYYSQPIVSARIFVFQFDVQNSQAVDSCDLIVYQMEPYSNLVLDRGTLKGFIQTSLIGLNSYDMLLSFGQRPSDVFQLYKSLKEYNVYNTITVKFQPKISTPDTLSRLVIELGTSYFSVLQGSIWDNLPPYNPIIQPLCDTIGQQIICEGVGSLSSQVIYIVSFKLLINYSYTINTIPSNFLSLQLQQSSSGNPIINKDGQVISEVRDGLPKMTDANTIAASFLSANMPATIEDALGSLKQLQYYPPQPNKPKASYVLGFLIKDDGTGVVRDNKKNKGYLIYTTPKISIADSTVQSTCLTKTNTKLTGCFIDSKTDITSFRFIGDMNPFQPQLVEKSSMVLIINNISINSFGQMGGQEVIDFYIQVYSQGLEEKVQQSVYQMQNYLVNGYVFSESALANTNIMAEIINYVSNSNVISIDAFNTVSLLKIKTNIPSKDNMMSANFDYPLKVEIFFDNMQLLPLYDLQSMENLSDPYEKKRISCIGDQIKCYSFPTQVYSNPALSSSYAFLALNRLQIQFDSVASMLSYNTKNILIPFIPVKNALKVNMFLTLSHVLKDYGLKKPLLYFKQVNRPLTFSFRDASTDSTIKVNDGSLVKYNLDGKTLGEIIDPLQIQFNYPEAPTYSPKYILYTTLWNYTNSFIPTSQISSFTANVQDLVGLTCQPINYIIQNLNIYGLLCPFIQPDSTQTQPSLLNTYISMSRIQFPYLYGTQLPRSSVSVIGTTGDLRSFAYLNRRSKVDPSTFNFISISPKSVMELQKGLELTFNIKTNHNIPPNCIFTISSQDSDNLNLNPVLSLANGCIINNDISISSTLVISKNQITCSFLNTQEIPSGNISILVVSISVLKKELDLNNLKEVEYMKTLVMKINTSRNVIVSKSDRGRKLLYQRQRQYGDSNSRISVDSINLKQISSNNLSLSFTLHFIQKDWDDFENLKCDLTSFFKQNPSNIDCSIVDITNNKKNFISKCYMSERTLLVTRNLDIKLYEISEVYSYQIEIHSINFDSIIQQNNLNPDGIFYCASIEPSSNNPILELQSTLSNLIVNYNLINIQPVGPINSGMTLLKQYTYPGLQGQLQIKFNSIIDEIAWEKNTIFRLSFPSRYISGITNNKSINCFQNKIYVPCKMLYSHTVEINSLALESKPSTTILEFFGVQEPSNLAELDQQGNSKEMFELIIIDGNNNSTLSYYKAFDINVPFSNNLDKIRFLNSSQTENVTFIQSDYYNFTMIFPKNTPQRTKLILEFPYSYADIFNNYQPSSCVMKAQNLKDISLQCIAQSNRISFTSDVSNTFTLLKNIKYNLIIRGLMNPNEATRCNSEKVNILVFDEGNQNTNLVMVSGEGQSAARNITLTSETTLTSFVLSKTSVDLVYGVASYPLTISISKSQRSQKQIEFSNKFNRFIQINPTVPVIPIGEYSTQFTIEVIDPTISGEFKLYISQFSSVTNPVIIDVPPITLNIFNPTDSTTVKNNFQISFSFTHFRIPQGGFSLPLFIEMNDFKPQKELIINAVIVDLPENGVSIHKGNKIVFNQNYFTSYIQLKSDASVSKLGAHGIVQLSLSGENASSFYLKDKILSFEIIPSQQIFQKQSSSTSLNDVQIFINPSTLSPISQIIQILSSQSLTLYYTVTSNFTQFNEISLKDIITNIQSGKTEEFNYMNQRQTQYGSWVYQGNSGLQDFYIQNHYENTMYLLKIFPLNSQGQFLGQFIGNYTTSSNSGKLLKCVFRFQSSVSVAQQIDLACKLSQYFAISQVFLTTTTGIRCDSPSTFFDVKLSNRPVKIKALDNPNAQFVSIYFSYNKADLNNNQNSQAYQQLVNSKQSLLSWYADQISSNRHFQKLLDYQAINNIQTDQPIMNIDTLAYKSNSTWIYLADIQLNGNGYVWIMADLAGNYPPNYFQLRNNLNSQNKQALNTYVSYYSGITKKMVEFNVTGLLPKTQYDFFLAITSDDSSENMSFPPSIYTLNLQTI